MMHNAMFHLEANLIRSSDKVTGLIMFCTRLQALSHDVRVPHTHCHPWSQS